jgi:hypothetical protein
MRKLIAPAFVLAALAFGCKKEDPAPPAVGAGGGGTGGPGPFVMDINGPFGIQLVIDGDTVTYVSGGALVHSYALHDVGGAPSTGRDYTAGIVGGDNSEFIASVRSGTLPTTPGVPVWSDEFQEFFGTGARVVGPPSTQYKWVSIMHRDVQGVEWSTQCGSTAQPGASFVIEEMQPEADEKGNFVRIKAHFNCTLYNCQTGASATVTDGRMVLLVGDF